jgi:hypothetical protein
MSGLLQLASIIRAIVQFFETAIGYEVLAACDAVCHEEDNEGDDGSHGTVGGQGG